MPLSDIDCMSRSARLLNILHRNGITLENEVLLLHLEVSVARIFI